MRAAVAHFAAAAVFAALYIGLYLNKNEEVESYETSCVRHLESLKSGDRSFDFEEYVSVKYGTKEGEEPGYSAIWKKDKNLTVEKIDASLSKKTFSKIDEYKPFVATARVEGKDFTATFVPLGFGADGGYIVSYRQDDYLAKLERILTRPFSSLF